MGGAAYRNAHMRWSISARVSCSPGATSPRRRRLSNSFCLCSCSRMNVSCKIWSASVYDIAAVGVAPAPPCIFGFRSAPDAREVLEKRDAPIARARAALRRWASGVLAVLEKRARARRQRSWNVGRRGWSSARAGCGCPPRRARRGAPVSRPAGPRAA